MYAVLETLGFLIVSFIEVKGTYLTEGHFSLGHPLNKRFPRSTQTLVFLGYGFLHRYLGRVQALILDAFLNSYVLVGSALTQVLQQFL